MDKDGKRTILAVDDSLLICQQIETALRGEKSVVVHTSHTGREALDMMKRCEPDLILLDIILPDMEGYELFERIKELDHNNASIVFITSKDSETDVIRGFSMGACDYIKKPFRPEEMKSRVLAHLDTKKQKDQLKLLNEELRATMERLNSMVFRDELTGLYNRHYVVEKLENELHESTRRDALIMVDVDDFKQINDTYGHEAGDTVLVCIASIMESICRKHKVVRWGGEEFLIVLLDADRAEAMRIAERIRGEIREFPFSHHDVTFFCTVTLGVSEYRKGESLRQNVEDTDRALYRGKRGGKNCCIFYEPEKA